MTQVKYFQIVHTCEGGYLVFPQEGKNFKLAQFFEHLNVPSGLGESPYIVIIQV